MKQALLYGPRSPQSWELLVSEEMSCCLSSSKDKICPSCYHVIWGKVELWLCDTSLAWVCLIEDPVEVVISGLVAASHNSEEHT